MATFDPRDPYGEFGIGPSGPVATQPPPPVQPAQTQAQILEDWQLGRIDTAAAYSALVDFYRANGFSNAATRAQFTLNNDAKARQEPMPFPDAKPISDPATAQGETVTAIPELATGVFAEGGTGYDPRTFDQIAREEASATRGGRENIFSGFVGGMPGFNALNPLLQRGLGRAFDPLSMQFNLQRLLGGPEANLNFRSFLGDSPQRFGQQDFRESLAPVGAAFNAGMPTAEQGTLLGAFSDKDLQNRIMNIFTGLGMSPALRQFVPGALARQRTSLFEQDPTANPFVQWLNNLGAPS